MFQIHFEIVLDLLLLGKVPHDGGHEDDVGDSAHRDHLLLGKLKKGFNPNPVFLKGRSRILRSQ